MYAVGKLSQYITQGMYTVSGPFHPFGGAVDIIVVQQQDGSFKSSPWYVKFGKFQGVLKAKEKLVKICVNGDKAPFHMYLDHKGEAHFLREVDSQEENSVFYITSSGDDSDEKSHRARLDTCQSHNIKDKRQISVEHINTENGKIVTRSNSRRNRFLGLMFGRKSMKEDGRHIKGKKFVERISSLESAEIAADLLDVKWSTNIKTDEVISRREDASCSKSEQKVQKYQAVLAEKPNGESHVDITNDVAHSTDVSNSNAMGSVDESVDSSDGLKPTNSDGEDSDVLRSIQEVCTTECSSLVVDAGTEPTIQEEGVRDTERGSDKYKQSAGTFCLIGAKFSSPDACEWASEVSAQEGFNLAGAVDMGSERSILGDDNLDIRSKEAIEKPNLESSCAIYIESKASVVLEISDLSNQSKEKPNGSKEDETSIEVQMSHIGSPPLSGSITSIESFSDSFCFEEDIDSKHIKELEVVQQAIAVEGLIEKKTLETNSANSQTGKTQFGVDEFSVELLSSDGNEVFNGEVSVSPNASPVDLVLYAAEIHPQSKSDMAHDSDLISQSVLGDNTYEAEEHELQIISLAFQESQPATQVENIATNAEDDQLLFGNVENVLLDSIPVNESRELDHDSLLCSNDQSPGSPMSDDTNSRLEEPNQVATLRESLFQEPTMSSSPISIMTNHALVKSLLSIQDDDVFVNNHPSNNQYLSRSLDSTSDVLKQAKTEENQLISLSSKSASEANLMNIQISTTENTDETKDALDLLKGDEPIRSPLPVEFSLCRHLLSEGMGAEAASLAFDSEKVNLEKFASLGPSVVNNDKLVVRINGCYFPWESAGPILLGMASFGQDYVFKPEGEILVEKLKKPSMEVIVSPHGTWGIWPFRFRRSKTVASARQKPDNAINDVNEIFDSAEDVDRCNTKSTKKVRAIVPTSEQLASLNLKDGRNIVTFTFSTAMLGEQQVDANIYMWKWNSKIVVSDVDGTITKSDVLGQFMPLVGKDWSQTGVAHLFSAIKENGYELLFLSARAISQAHLTRQFLFNLKQDGKALPDGPVVISPDGLFPSLFREVIRRAPHEFKIACLEEIRALFPPHCNPFYAGFGNRNTDELSYIKVGIPKGKIFTINPKGEVVVHQRIHKKTYTSLHALVDGMFPAARSLDQEEFNSWNYWRTSIPEIDI